MRHCAAEARSSSSGVQRAGSPGNAGSAEAAMGGFSWARGSGFRGVVGGPRPVLFYAVGGYPLLWGRGDIPRLDVDS